MNVHRTISLGILKRTMATVIVSIRVLTQQDKNEMILCHIWPVVGTVFKLTFLLDPMRTFLCSLWGGSGAIIRIDNVSHVIDHIRDGVFVSPGVSTYVALDREFKTILPKPVTV